MRSPSGLDVRSTPICDDVPPPDCGTAADEDAHRDKDAEPSPMSPSSAVLIICHLPPDISWIPSVVTAIRT